MTNENRKRRRARRRLRIAGIAAIGALAATGLTGCFDDDDGGGDPGGGDGITELTNTGEVESTPPEPTETDLQRSDPAGSEPELPEDTGDD